MNNLTNLPASPPILSVPTYFKNPQTGKSQPIARHTEIEDGLAKRIIKRLC